MIAREAGLIAYHVSFSNNLLAEETVSGCVLLPGVEKIVANEIARIIDRANEIANF